MPSSEVPAKLEITGPTVECGHCRFGSALDGTFSVEDGLLVWRGKPDVQPGRGPSLESCCESWDIAVFTEVTWYSRAEGTLSDEDVAALRASARAAVEADMAWWHASREKP